MYTGARVRVVINTSTILRAVAGCLGWVTQCNTYELHCIVQLDDGRVEQILKRYLCDLREL